MILKAAWTWTLSLLSGCFRDHIKVVFKFCLNWTQRWTKLVGRGCHQAVMYRFTLCYQCVSQSQSLTDLSTTKLPLIWTCHRCILKVLHTTIVYDNEGVFPKSRCYQWPSFNPWPTHTCVDIQCWTPFCPILKQTYFNSDSFWGKTSWAFGGLFELEKLTVACTFVALPAFVGISCLGASVPRTHAELIAAKLV